MGLTAIDLLEEKDWEIARTNGLVCRWATLLRGKDTRRLNNKANHDVIVRVEDDPGCRKNGVPNLIAFFGNRRGMSDAEARNCVIGLNRIKPAESRVTVCVELLNSKNSHKDYQGDHSSLASGNKGCRLSAGQTA
jgi:hydroxypyruvate isomerase